MITFKELEEQLDEAHKVGDKVLIHKGPADVKGKEGHVSEIRKGLYKGAPKTYTVDYDHHETTGARKSIQLKPTHFKAVKEDLDEARMTAAMKLQQAFQREQEKTARERKAGEDLLKKKEEPKKTNEEADLEEGYFVHREKDTKLHFNTVAQLRQSKTPSHLKVTDHKHKHLGTVADVLRNQTLYKTEEVEQIDETPKDHTIEAHGIKGMKRTPWRKTFKHEDHLHDWAEKNDADVHGTRELEGAKKSVKEGLKPQHNMRPGWMLKADPELAAKVKKNKDIAKARKASYGNPAAGKSVKEDAACNNVGGGAIAGTQGDAGKKSVAIKMMKRKELKNFKEFTESCDCWTGYKRVPGTKPCEKGSCKKA